MTEGVYPRVDALVGKRVLFQMHEGAEIEEGTIETITAKGHVRISRLVGNQAWARVGQVIVVEVFGE